MSIRYSLRTLLIGTVAVALLLGFSVPILREYYEFINGLQYQRHVLDELAYRISGRLTFSNTSIPNAADEAELCRFLASPHKSLRLEAMTHIRDKFPGYGSDNVIRAIGQNYERDPEFRQITLSCLYGYQERLSCVSEVIVKALEDPDPMVRYECAKAVYYSRLNTPEVYDGVSQLLLDPDPTVKRTATYTLRLMGSDLRGLDD